MGAQWAALTAGAEAPAAARRRSRPKLGLLDLVWAPVWPWGNREVCAIHWSGRQGAAGDGAGCTAWSGGARPPACGARAPPWVSGYDDSCKRKRRSGRCSPRAWGGWFARRREPAARSGRRSDEARRRGRSRGSPGSWVARLDPRRPCGKDTGVRGAPGPLAARNCSGGAYRRRRSWQRDAAALVIRAWSCGRGRVQGGSGLGV